MSKKGEVLTVHEWDAIVRGRAVPVDLFVGESVGHYVHRKLGKLIEERDRLQRNLDECNAELEGVI
jgi:hypothetical protein